MYASPIMLFTVRWWHLLAVLLLSHQGAPAKTAVPVMVSTVSRSTPRISDLTVDGNGNVLYVSSIFNAVYRLASDGSVRLLAGSGNNTFGAADGAGSAATFYNPQGIACDTTSNVSYIGDVSNFRIRTVALANNNVTTLAGNAIGHADGIGRAAQFYYPTGIVYHSSGNVLYIAEDVKPSFIRRVTISSANVTTVASLSIAYNWSYYLRVNNVGTLLFVTTNYVILQVNVSSGAVVVLAGAIEKSGYADGVGSNALFSNPRGIALNSDESALLIADADNQCIRRLELVTNNVTTIAGNRIVGSGNGPGLTSTFNAPIGVKWHCNVSTILCGVLVADFSNNALRFVAIEGRTTTAAISAEATATLSTSHEVSPSPSPTSSPFMSSSSSFSVDELSPSTSHSVILTRSNATFAPTSSCSLLPSLSVTSTISKSASNTRLTPSASASMYCALVPADGDVSVSSLQPFPNSTTAQGYGVIPLSSSSIALLGASAGAAPVSRAALLRNVPLGANLSLSLGGTSHGSSSMDGWAVVNVTVNVLPIGGALGDVPFTQLSSTVVGHKQSLLLLLGPPNATTPPRWLPTSLSTFRDVTLVLQLSLRCTIAPSITTVVSIKVPCPGEVQALASEVKTVGSASQYSTSFAGPAAGGAVGRIASVRSLVLCSGGEIVEGLLPLVVNACGVAGGTVASDARGGILGNLVLWVAACVLMSTIVAAYAQLAHTSLRGAAAALGVPSPLLPLVVVTVPSTVSSTFYLLHSPVCASDGVVAALGVVMCVCPIAVLCLVAFAVPRHLTLVEHQQPNSTEAEHSQQRSLTAYAARLSSALFQRRLRWRDVNGHSINDTSKISDAAPLKQHSSRTWLRAATVLLLDYAAVWYACVDVAVLTASCVLGALSTLESVGACRGGAIGTLLLYAGQLALCASVRPFTSLFSHVYALFSLALSSVAVACQVWYLYGSVAYNVDLDALSKLLTVAAVCDLLVSGVSMLKALADAVDAVRACRPHLLVMFARPPKAKRVSLDAIPAATTEQHFIVGSTSTKYAETILDRSDDDVDEVGGDAQLLPAHPLPALLDMEDAHSWWATSPQGNLMSHQNRLSRSGDGMHVNAWEMGEGDVVGVFTAQEAMHEMNDLMRMYGMT